MYQVTSPFQQFFDTSGKPLEDGRIYVGVANQNPKTTPIAIYWDEAGTIPAAQPLNVSAGYIVRNGAPARAFFALDDFSISVYDKKGGLVYYEPSVTSIASLRAELATPSTGAGLIGWIRNSANAVATTLLKWMDRSTVSVFDFMTDAQAADVKAGTLLIDVTTAVQNAIDSVGSGRKLTFHGNMRISAPLNFPNNGITFEGENQWTSRITQVTQNVAVINNTGVFNQFQNFSISYSAAVPSSGATAIYSWGGNTRISSIIVMNCDVGFDITSGTAQMADNFQIFNYETCGVRFGSSNDLFISKFILNAGDTARGRLGGIRLVNKAEAFICSDGDILLGVYSMTTDAAVNAPNVRPAYNNFSNMFFDSSVEGCLLQALVETEFLGCWFSGGRDGLAGKPGCTVDTCDSLNFIGTRFFNCGSHGCAVSSSSKHTSFIGCSFESNSVTSGVGVAHGLFISPNTADFTVLGCKASNGLYGGEQGFGIIVNNGTSSGYSICNNMLTGNKVAALSDGGSGAVKKITGNVGHFSEQAGSGVIAAGASSAVINHGLTGTPPAQKISLTPTVPTSGSALFLDTTSITSTQFTVRSATAVAADTYFVWQAQLSGN